MPPLYTRPPSLHSWWSDSNPALAHSPTINLHAAAKPLMKFMYHRQALALIRKNRGKPLSRTTLEIYTSYFQWDFVSWSTKTAILLELTERASDVDEARAVVDSPDFFYIMQMLKSPDIGARISSCRLIGNLTIHDCATGSILEPSVCAQLVSMLRDKDIEIVDGRAAHALINTALSLDGAQAIVDAGALSHVSTFLESSSPNIRKRTCLLMGILAQHESTRAAVVDALINTAFSLDGAQVIVDAGALNHVSTFLESSSPNIRKRTCLLMGILAQHESTRAAVVALKLFETLVTLLRDEDSEVVDEAAYALFKIAHSIDGAQGIVDAGALNHVLGLLQSPSLAIREYTCVLVGNLASHESTTVAVLTLKPYKLLVSLLGDEYSNVILCAVYALSHIARSFEGAQAIVNAGALNRFFGLLESPSFDIRKWTCVLVGALASHHETSTIAPAGLELKSYKRLTSFFRHSPTITRPSAMFALCAISEWPDGVAELADPDIVQELRELSHSLAITCLDDELSLEYLHTTMENITRYIDGIGIAL